MAVEQNPAYEPVALFSLHQIISNCNSPIFTMWECGIVQVWE